MRPRELLRRIQAGNVENIAFSGFERLLFALGFQLERVSGSHQIYRHARTRSKLNLPPRQRMMKGYQVRQALEVIAADHLSLDDDAEQ